MAKGYILGIGGSSRREGNTNKALEFVLNILSKKGFETELIRLCDVELKIDPCSKCTDFYSKESPCSNRPVGCIAGDDFSWIFQKMIRADAIIIGAPVYWGSAPPKLMELLHRAGMQAEGRVSPDKPIPDRSGWPETKGLGLFARKLGAVISTARRSGANFTLAQIWSWFFLLNFIVVGSTYWPVAYELPQRVPIVKNGKVTVIHTGRPRHPTDLVETDIEFKHTLENLAENIAWLLEKIKEEERFGK